MAENLRAPSQNSRAEEGFKTRTLTEAGESVLPEAYERAQKIIAQHQIDPSAFGNLYDTEKIARDIATAERKNEDFQNGRSSEEIMLGRWATVMEAMLYEQIELSDWFGPRARTVKTSRFDDIRHGIDSVIEFENVSSGDQAPIRIALDVTYTKKHIQEKFALLKRQIHNNKLGKVTYFESEITGEQQKLEAPRVIIGVEWQKIFHAAEAWIAEGRQALAHSLLQFIFLREISVELKMLGNYAEKHGKAKVAKAYKEAYALFSVIVAEKARNISRDEAFEVESDAVLQAILVECERFQS